MNNKYPIQHDQVAVVESSIGYESQSFRTDVDYCAPEQIGLAAELVSGEKTHVVAMFDMEGTTDTVLHTAVVRIESLDPAQDDKYILWAMKQEGDDLKLIEDKTAVAMLAPGEPMLLGRQFGEHSRSTDLWPGDKPDISREHTAVTLESDGSVAFAHLSAQKKSGTTVRGVSGSMPQQQHEALDEGDVVTELIEPEVVATPDLVEGFEPELVTPEEVVPAADEVSQQESVAAADASEEASSEQQVVTPKSSEAELRPQPRKNEEDQVFERRKLSALLGAQERLGLSDETSKEQVLKYLEDKMNSVGVAIRGLADFEPVVQRMQREIHETLSAGMNRLTGSVRRETENFIMSEQFKELERIARSTSGRERFLSRILDQKIGSILRFRGEYDAMTSRGLTYIETEAANRVLGLIRDFEGIKHGLSQEMNEAHDLYSRVSSYREADRLYHEMLSQNEQEYRNEQVKRWATELQSKTITPERTAEIEEQMLTAVAIEVGMDGDPTSPQIWFDDAVVENRGKSRRDGTPVSGREDANIGSQQNVAELMSEILRGTFSVDVANSVAPIHIDEKKPDHSKVVNGRHRVAALAMLYGKDWIKTAESMGMMIRRS